MPSLLCVLPMLSAPVLAPSAVRVAVRLTPRPAIQAAPAAVMEAPAPVLVPFRAVHDHEYWNQLGLDEVYHTYAAVLEVTAVARIRFFSNARSMTFLTKTPVMPSLPLLPCSPTRTSALTLTLMLLVNVLCWGAYTDLLYGGLFIWRAVCMSVFLYFFGTGSTSPRYQMVFANFHLEIITPLYVM